VAACGAPSDDISLITDDSSEGGASGASPFASLDRKPNGERPLAAALAPLTDGGIGGVGGRGLGIRVLVSKMVGLLGGREATEKLVRTASFR
jgi:hypothetical protein